MGDVDPDKQDLCEGRLDRFELQGLESVRLGLPLHRRCEDYSETTRCSQQMRPAFFNLKSSLGLMAELT